MEFRSVSGPIDRLWVECLICILPKDSAALTQGVTALIDWRLNGFLSRVLLKDIFSMNSEEKLLIPTQGRMESKQIMIFGMGEKDRAGEQELKKIFESAKRLRLKRLALPVEAFAKNEEELREKISTCDLDFIEEIYLYSELENT